VVCLAECFVSIDLWDFFTKGKHPETEQVAINTLTISGQGVVLHVPSDGPLEQRSTVYTL